MDEGEAEANISKPRFTVQNIGSSRLTGVFLRYRLSVDPGKTPVLEANWYLAGGSAALVNVGGGLWDVRLSWPNQVIEPGQVFPNSAGVIIGLHHTDWTAWDKSDDPSHQGTTSFQVNGKVLVEGPSGVVLSGSFPTLATGGSPAVLAAVREEAPRQSNVSKIRVVARNVGSGATDSLRLEYHFATEGSRRPILDVHENDGARLTLKQVTGRNWKVEIDYSGHRLKPGRRTSQRGASFSLHYADWSAWDKRNDRSNPGGEVFAISTNVVSLTENGQISGKEPTPTELALNEALAQPLPARSLVAAATDASYLLKPDGTVWGWGYVNQFSRFGTASRYGRRFGGVTQEYPVQVSELRGIRDISASGDHLLALDADGVVWAVGSTNRAQVLAARAGADQMAIGTCDRPTAIGGLSGIVQVSTGGWARNLALDQTGQVWQWGMPTNRNEDWVGPPHRIRGTGASTILTGVVAIRSCEGLSMGMTSTGEVYGWNLTTDEPTRIALQGVRQLACNDGENGGLLLLADGSLEKVTGPNSAEPFKVVAIPGTGPYTRIEGQAGRFVGQAEDGSVSVWDRWDATPVQVAGFQGATSLAASYGHALAVLPDGSVKAVGDGRNGALGDGSLASSTVPVVAAIRTDATSLTGHVEIGNTAQELVFENNSTANQSATVRLLGARGNKVRVVYTNVSTTTAAAVPGATTPAIASGPGEPVSMELGVVVGGQSAVVNDADPLAESPTSGTVTTTWEVGDARTWNMFDRNAASYSSSVPNVTVATTCRKVVSTATRSFLFWVDNAQWGDENGMINAAKLDALAAKLATDEVSVYQSVREVVGEEWGVHGSAIHIPETTTDFNIVLSDLDNDLDPVSNRGYVLGYFWGTDLSLATATNKSNAAVAIYLDSRWLGYAASGRWSATNSNAVTVYNTAAHELQHMVYFYQRRVKRGFPTSVTWPNEMLSVMTEEVLASELGWASTSPRKNRFPRWMSNSNKSFTVWDRTSTNSYEAAFAYGFLLFGNLQPDCEIPAGSNVCDGNTANGFHAIQRSSKDGLEAVEEAFIKDGQRGAKEWLRIEGVTLATGAASKPDEAEFKAWNVAGRAIGGIQPWSDFRSGATVIAPTILSAPPASIVPFASVPVEMDVPVSGELQLDVPANTWVTVIPNY